MAPGNANSTFGGYAAAALVNPTAAAVFVRAADATKAANIWVKPLAISGGTGTAVNVLRFYIRAWGRATSGTTSNFLAKLQYGTSATAGSNTDVFTLTNRSYVSANGEWAIDFNGVWSATSQKITGNGSGWNLATLETPLAATAVTGVDFTQSNLGFSVAALFGSTNAGNVCYLDALTLEIL